MPPRTKPPTIKKETIVLEVPSDVVAIIDGLTTDWQKSSGEKITRDEMTLILLYRALLSPMTADTRPPRSRAPTPRRRKPAAH